jgi:hypothetical protein
MTFLNPWMLFGLAAASVPLVLHLLTLRKLRTVDFSSLRFLRELQVSHLRKLKLRQLLLLILRTLLVLLLVFAFARPVLRGSASWVPGGRAAATMVLLLDDSPSMSARDDQGVRFGRAVDAARALLDLTGPDDNVLVLPLSSLAGTAPLPAPHTVHAARTALAAATVSSLSVPWRDALTRARSVLASSDAPNRELYVITDAQAAPLRPARIDTSAAEDPRMRLFVVRIADRPLENAAVTGVRVLTRMLTPGRPARIEATVAHYGPAARRDAVVSAYLEGSRVAQTAVDLPPYSVTTVPFTIVPRRRGFLAGGVRIETDAFGEDDARPFVLPLPDSLRILLAGETPEACRLPAIALSLEGDSLLAGLLQPRVVPRERLGALDWNAYDVAILCAFRSFTAAEVSRIGEFLSAGHGALIFAGPDIDPASYALAFGGATSGGQFRLRPPATPGEPAQGDAGPFVSFASIDMTHPLFQGLLLDEPRSSRRGKIESPRVFAATVLPEGPRARRIIGLTDGSPFLVEYMPPRGRLLIAATDAAGHFSDFPSRGLFAPFLVRAAGYLAGGRDHAVGAVAGDRLAFPLDSRSADRPLVLRHPSGTDERPTILRSRGSAIAQSGPARETGVYSLFPADAPDDILGRGAVAIDTAESPLLPADETTLRHVFSTAGFSPAQIFFLPPGAPAAATVVDHRFGVELWLTALVLAILCALTELLVARVSGTPAEGSAQ